VGSYDDGCRVSYTGSAYRIAAADARGGGVVAGSPKDFEARRLPDELVNRQLAIIEATNLLRSPHRHDPRPNPQGHHPSDLPRTPRLAEKRDLEGRLEIELRERT
jgi:hypothetical protein